jgi:lipopolysaccharide/colanic/teichoic acid biosynthesis glycosyltransferase
MLKRLLEIFISVIALLLLSPIFICIIVLIYFKMGLPVLFIQKRVGKKGNPFSLYKFRTMSQFKSARKGSFDIGCTKRISSIGKILRKSKFDELPQLINVLKGDMSIVGPRPEVKKWTEVYSEKWRIVHFVKPGITDNASIEFRNEEEILSQSDEPIKTYRDVILPRKLDLYIDYVNNQSFWGDIKIIFKTIKVVLLK